MTPERWKRIEALYHATRERSGQDRAAFLLDACADDESLRRDVESLLAEGSSDDGFLGQPAVVRGAEMLSDVPAATMTGRSIGRYTLQRLIGAGGMGEVYQSHDATLGRDVAIKILPQAFTRDPDRLARLGREARMLAALSHPNICGIYGLEEADAIRFLLLEFVNGETLAELLARLSRPQPGNPGLSVGDALTFARQIADALEAAHEKGIVHRDLKPANIKITAGGVVKVLDFGLAKSIGVNGSSPDITHPPGADAARPGGAVIGTAAYMSPEQARGLAVDKRTDIWAFGCVLYEMLTSRHAFPGQTVSDTIAKILEREPDWSALPATTPASIRRLLLRCLVKDPRQRLRDMGDARIEIDGVEDGQPNTVHESSPRPSRSTWFPWSVAGMLAIGCTLLLVAWAPWRGVARPVPARVPTELTADPSIVGSASTQFGGGTILSPAGDLIAFVAQSRVDGRARIYLRRLGELDATPMPGTERPLSPFFSPDGRSIGFFADGSLKTVSVAGGAPVSLTEVLENRGGSWSEDGTIVFAPRSTGGPLMAIPSSGGIPKSLTTLGEGELVQLWPQMLPGGKAVLFTSSNAPGSNNDADLVVQTLPNGPRRIVQHGGYHGRYVPSGVASAGGADRDNGHLLYIRDGKLFATPFDLSRLSETGATKPVLNFVRSNSNTGGAQFAASANGTLVYVPGPTTSEIPIHWMGRDGTTTPLRTERRNWYNPAFSPDGGRLALEIRDGGPGDIWILELSSGRLTRLTSWPGQDRNPVWSPDGQAIVFASDRDDRSALNLYLQRADGTGAVQRLTESRNLQRPSSWHGSSLMYTEENSAVAVDVMRLRVDGNGTSGWKPDAPVPFLNEPALEADAIVSPDGRWVAYVSTESKQNELYVRPFPGPGPKWMISSDGGGNPVWSPTTNELFFGQNGRIMVARYRATRGSFQAQTAELWAEAYYTTRGGRNRMFALDPITQRFVLAPATDGLVGGKLEKVVLLFNFFDELRRLAPSSR